MGSRLRSVPSYRSVVGGTVIRHLGVHCRVDVFTRANYRLGVHFSVRGGIIAVVVSASNSNLRGEKCHGDSGSTPLGRALTTTVYSLTEVCPSARLFSPFYKDNAVLVRTTLVTAGATPKLEHFFTTRHFNFLSHGV